MRASVNGLDMKETTRIGLLLGMKKVLLELVPSQVSWGRHHRVGGTQAIIGNWRGWDAAL